MTDAVEATPSVDQLHELVAAATEQERRARVRGLALTIIPLAVGAVWLAVSFARVRDLQTRAGALSESNRQVVEELARSRAQGKTLEARVSALNATQAHLLQFIRDVTAAENIRLVDPRVDWEATKAAVIAMPAGTRKAAVLGAILLAWKELPFSTQNRGLASGLDSPHFINLILQQFGAGVDAGPGQRLSDAMMDKLAPSERPLPGDLLFYKGNVGSFVVMYLAPGASGGQGVAVGTLQTGEEIQIVDTVDLNTERYPFIGAYRVEYPAEIPVRSAIATDPPAAEEDDSELSTGSAEKNAW